MSSKDSAPYDELPTLTLSHPGPQDDSSAGEVSVVLSGAPEPNEELRNMPSGHTGQEESPASELRAFLANGPEPEQISSGDRSAEEFFQGQISLKEWERSREQAMRRVYHQSGYMGFQTSRGGFLYMLEQIERIETEDPTGFAPLASGWKLQHLDIQDRGEELISEVRCGTAMASWRDVLAARCLGGNGDYVEDCSPVSAAMTLSTTQCFRDMFDNDKTRYRYHTVPFLMSVWAGYLSSDGEAVPCTIAGLHHSVAMMQNQRQWVPLYAISYKHTVDKIRSDRTHWKELSLQEPEQESILSNLLQRGKFWYDGMDTPWDGGASSVLYGLTAYITQGVRVLLHLPTTLGVFSATPLPNRYDGAQDALDRALASQHLTRLPLLWGDYMRSWLLAESFCGAIRGSVILTSQSRTAVNAFKQLLETAKSMAESDQETAALAQLSEDIEFFENNVWTRTSLPFPEFVEKYMEFVNLATASREGDKHLLKALVACVAYTSRTFEVAIKRARHYITRDDPIIAVLLDVEAPRPFWQWFQPTLFRKTAFASAFALLSREDQQAYTSLFPSFTQNTPSRPAHPKSFEHSFTDFEHGGGCNIGYWLVRHRFSLGDRHLLLKALAASRRRLHCSSENLRTMVLFVFFCVSLTVFLVHRNSPEE